MIRGSTNLMFEWRGEGGGEGGREGGFQTQVSLVSFSSDLIPMAVEFVLV